MNSHERTVTATRLLFENASDKLMEAHQILFTDNNTDSKRRRIIELLMGLPEHDSDETNTRESSKNTRHAFAIIRAALQSFGDSSEECVFLDQLDLATTEKSVDLPWREGCLKALKATAGLCFLIHKGGEDDDAFISYASLLVQGTELSLDDLARYWQIERAQAAEFLSKSVADAIKEPKLAFQVQATFDNLHLRFSRRIVTGYLTALIREVNYKLLNALEIEEKLSLAVAHLKAQKNKPRKSS